MPPEWTERYQLSTEYYDPNFDSKINKVDLVSSARNILKFLLKVREEGIIFKNYEKPKLGNIIHSSVLPFYLFSYIFYFLY
jgi:hypothetical protein